MPEVPAELNLATLWATYGSYIISFGLKALGALAVLIIGLRVASWLGHVMRRLVDRNARIDRTLGAFFASLVRWFVTAAVFIAALQIFGVQATSFVAILGALTLAIGLSMQGALGNIASGVMIMVFRPYKLGDYIEIAGQAGSVADINLFQTELATVDNVKILIPNTQAIGGIIKNYSGYDTRRVDLTFTIDYDDSIDEALKVIRICIAGDDRVLAEPAPWVQAVNLGASGVELQSRTWVKAADYFDVKFDLTKQVKEALMGAGMTIPYPHQTQVEKRARA